MGKVYTQRDLNLLLSEDQFVDYLNKQLLNFSADLRLKVFKLSQEIYDLVGGEAPVIEIEYFTLDKSKILGNNNDWLRYALVKLYYLSVIGGNLSTSKYFIISKVQTEVKDKEIYFKESYAEFKNKMDNLIVKNISPFKANLEFIGPLKIPEATSFITLFKDICNKGKG